MSTRDPSPFAGARWWKFDFHTHTPASLDTYWAKRGQPLTPRDWLLRYMAAGVDCVAVTDHNSGAWIDQLAAANAALAEERPEGYRPLHLFPGVELSVNGGFHLLAVFDVGVKGSKIDGLLDSIRYRGTRGGSDAASEQSAVEVLRTVVDLDGLAIPAHAERPDGLLQLDGAGGRASAIDPGSLRQVCGEGTVLAAEVVDPSVPKPALYDELGCSWTQVVGTDSHSFQGAGAPGSRFTWVKMEAPSLEGLALALHDGASYSVRRSDDLEPFDPSKLPHHVIESVEISNARFMGHRVPARLALSPWLNALVGGRGTGKSTVVHALRLAFRRDQELEALPADDDARRTFDRFRREPVGRQDPAGALDYAKSRKTEIVVVLRRDGVRHRLRWRQDGQLPAVEVESDGAWIPAPSQAISPERFPVRIFSQGQIAALAGESQQALLTVIDQNAGAGPLRARIEEEERRFFALRAQLRGLDATLRASEPLKVQAEDVRRKLAGFEGKQHTAVLKEFQVRSRQVREVERQTTSARRMASRLAESAREVLPEDVPSGLFDDEALDRAATEVIAKLHEEVRKAGAAVRNAASALEAAAASAEATLGAGPWHVAVQRAREAYAALVEELKARGVGDPSEYGRLVQESQRIEGELARVAELEKQRARLADDVAAQRRFVREARRALTERRRTFLGSTLAGNPYVRIEVQPYGADPEEVERSLRTVLDLTDGRFAEAIRDDERRTGFVAGLLSGSEPSDREDAIDGLAKRFEQAAAGREEFGGKFDRYLERTVAARPEVLDRLLVWSPEDALRVEYSPRGDGREFRPMAQASAGQRAAAMLALLLSHGEEPLVLDQPEDDLDNHLIYELVVRQLRENKRRRQVVVVTHNPNIVVNGDAEMVHALDFFNGQCQVVQSGSLQRKAMRDEVCRVMEGGREAFERRYHRLVKDR